MSTSPERYARIKALLLAARERAETDRERWVREHADDAELADEVLELLAREHAASGILDGGVLRAAAGLAAPERIGPYIIEEVIGEGGMGVVYRARQEEPIRRHVALKLIRWGMHHESVVRRFEHERRTLARMDHPHIATVLDAGTDEHGHPWFVMPLVEGLPLLEFCDHERLDVPARLRLFEDVCRAVHHAHARGILHRDLKPGNVLVRRVSGRPVPVIIDFGIAKALQEEDETMMLTREGQRVGTPAYMSPEQLAGEEDAVDARSDVYSLGVILYELLAGQHPFRGATDRETSSLPPRPPSTAVSGVDTGELAERRSTSPRALRRALQGDVDTICLMAIRPEPERRYASAAHLADDLRRLREGHPVDARPDSWRYRARKFVGRHPAATALLAAAVVAIAAGATGLSWHAQRMAVERDRALAAERRALGELETSRAVTSFMEDLFELARADLGGDADLTALEMLDQADEKVAEDLAGQPWLQAELYRTLGVVNHALSRLDEARALLERALAANDSITGQEPPEIDHQRAEILVAYATIQHDFGQYEVAIEECRRARQLFVRSGVADSTDVARALSMLGTNLQASGRLEESLAPTRRSLELSEEYGTADDPEVPWGWGSLGYIDYQLGHLDAAHEEFQRAVDISRRIFTGDHYDLAHHLNNLGGFYLAIGQPRRAEPLLVENLEMNRRIFATEPHGSLARAYLNLARARLDLEEPGRALQLLEEGHQISIDALGHDHPRTALYELWLARARQRNGDADGAIALATAAARTIFGASDPQDRDAMRAHLSLGKLLLLRGEYAAAREHLSTYRSWIEARHPAGHFERCAADEALAAALLGAGETERARELATAAVEGYRANFGAGSLHYQRAEALLRQIETKAGPPPDTAG